MKRIISKVENFIDENELPIACCIVSFFIGNVFMWFAIVGLKS